jgi:hypothetical protein
VECSFELAVGDAFGQVDDGPAGSRHGKAAKMTNVLRREARGLVDLQPGAASFPRQDGHVDVRVIDRRQHVPHHGRRAMADCGRRPGRQHRGHLARERHKRQMADRVYAPVEPMEVVVADARLDRARANPHREQLRAGHHPVLPPREISDEPVLRYGAPTRPLHRQVHNSPFDARTKRVADLFVLCNSQLA